MKLKNLIYKKLSIVMEIYLVNDILKNFENGRLRSVNFINGKMDGF